MISPGISEQNYILNDQLLASFVYSLGAPSGKKINHKDHEAITRVTKPNYFGCLFPKAI